MRTILDHRRETPRWGESTRRLVGRAVATCSLPALAVMACSNGARHPSGAGTGGQAAGTGGDDAGAGGHEAGAGGHAAGTGGQGGQGGGDGGPMPTTYQFQPMPVAATTEVPNPMKGLYDWYGTTSPARAPVTSVDEYFRFSWADLESTQGTYDFSPIEKKASALAPGHRLSFRIQSVDSCHSTHQGTDVPAYLVGGMGWMAPSSGASSSSCVNQQVYVPDWNSSAYLDAVKNLVTALGAKYDQDPRIGWIDIGLQGDWGEWHVSEFPYCDSNYNKMGALLPTQATYQAIIDAHVAAFPHKQLLMVVGDNMSLPYALSLNPPIPIGIKRDSWGANKFPMLGTLTVPVQPAGGPTPGGQCTSTHPSLSASDLDTVTSRWTTAPFIVESYGGSEALQVGDQGIVTQVLSCNVSAVGNGSWGAAWSSLTASDQQAFLQSGIDAGYRIAIREVDVVEASPTAMKVTATWANDGDAPPYAPWSVAFYLYDVGASQVVATVTSSVNLKTLLPTVSYGTCGAPTAGPVPQMTTQSITDTLPLASVAPGSYDLRVKVTDPGNYLAPLALAILGGNPDGSYSIGTVAVH